MKKSQILAFFIIYVSLSILKTSSKSGTWNPKPVRFGMEHTIKCYRVTKMFLKIVSNKSSIVQKDRRTKPPYFFICGGAEATSRSTPLF